MHSKIRKIKLCIIFLHTYQVIYLVLFYRLRKCTSRLFSHRGFILTFLLIAIFDALLVATQLTSDILAITSGGYNFTYLLHMYISHTYMYLLHTYYILIKKPIAYLLNTYYTPITYLLHTNYIVTVLNSSCIVEHL